MGRFLKEILLAYRINPIIINKVTENLYHVRDGKQEYALKKSKVDKEIIKHWEAIYRFSISNQLSAVLPVYITEEGKLYYEYNQEIYYVSPWIDIPNEIRSTQWITDFYTTLARLHSNTKKEHQVDMENISEQFQSFQSYCHEMRNSFMSLIRQFERNQYMSPIELLICSQFRDVELAFIEIDKRIQRFIHDHEDGKITWTSCLCHRNLKKAHIKGTFFINWESARYDQPTMDLIQFFDNEIGRFNPQSNQFIDLFSTYMEINKLTLHELQYFSIYMLSPINYIRTIQDYVLGQRNETMIESMKNIQHEYRKVLFGISWSKYIEETYETLNLDDLEI